MTTQDYLNILESGQTPSTDSVVSYGLSNALTVMLVVFAVLGILYLILTFTGALFSRINQKPEKREKKQK
ncbi:MAG: OadG family protein [Clostridia bacterium]|nr:OadG family protein [Clostridia bacterium]